MLLERLGFTKGAMPSLDPSVVPTDALWEARNVRIDESGVLRIRPGHLSVFDSLGPGPVQGAIEAFSGLLIAWGKNLYKVSNSTTTKIGENVMGKEASNPIEFIRWARDGDEIVYIFTGNGLYETAGEDTELVNPKETQAGEPANLLRNDEGEQDSDSGPARCRFAVLRASIGQRIAAAGDPDSPNTVYLSAPLDATYWPNDQIIQLPDDGAKITGLANWYNTLVIFRDRDIWAFIGADATAEEQALILQTSSIGCIAGRTIADVPGMGLVFLGPDNVYALRGVTALENRAEAVPVGEGIRRLLQRSMADGVNGACGVYFDREYRLSLPASMRQERVFRLGSGASWFVDTLPRTSCYLVSKGCLYSGLWTEGGLVRAEPSWLYDNLDGIPFYAAFRREALGSGPARIKRMFLYVPSRAREGESELFWFAPAFGDGVFGEGDVEEAKFLHGTLQDLDIVLVVDGNQFHIHEFQVNVQREQTIEFRGLEPVRVLEVRFHPSLQGHFAQLRISANVPGQDISLLGYAIEYESRKRLRGREVG